MDLRQSESWRRHQLATVERMQADVALYTHPVMRVVGLSGVAYLIAWSAMMVWKGAHLPLAMEMIAGMTAAVVLFSVPAFALATGIECYFRRRLARFHAGVAQPAGSGCSKRHA